MKHVLLTALTKLNDKMKATGVVNGMCDLIAGMNLADELTNFELEQLEILFKKEGFTFMMYAFEPGKSEPRIAWCEEQIERVKKEITEIK